MCRKESSTSRQCPSAQHWGSPPTTSSQPGGIFRPMGRDPGIQSPCLQQRGPPHSVKKQFEALKTPHVVSLLALWKGSRCNYNIVPDERSAGDKGRAVQSTIYLFQRKGKASWRKGHLFLGFCQFSSRTYGLCALPSFV